VVATTNKTIGGGERSRVSGDQICWWQEAKRKRKQSARASMRRKWKRLLHGRMREAIRADPCGGGSLSARAARRSVVRWR
jgi:hypothetical protein